MHSENQVLAIDAGNTSIKAAYFKNDKLETVKRFDNQNFTAITKWYKELSIKTVFVSSVLDEEQTTKLLGCFDSSILISHASNFPILNQYLTPKTLGIDRIANACYANANMNTEYGVCIDIGTCIKFDTVHVEKGYLGGSISPGIHLRYKSLNDYTGNLPLLNDTSIPALIGKNTEQSIHSGVINGMQSEIQQLMHQYEEQFDDLTFFVTGGDASFFDLHSKNDIFADENLTLNGLYEIFKFNA